MAADLKVVPREPSTPATGTGLRTTVRMPEELVAEQVQRLGLFSAVAGALWTFGLAMDLFFLRIASTTFMPSAVVTTIELSGIVAAAAMYAFVRYAPATAERKANLGIAFLLLNTFDIGLMNALLVPLQVPAMHVSWTVVAILVFSMIVPTTPRKMLAACLAAASMDPLGVAIMGARGMPVPSLVNTLVLFLPNYACALVATVPSHVFQRWGRRLREAQELGSYHLTELLGRGGMGEVWLAKHRLLARSAAIKLVRPEVLGAATEADARMVMKRFEREAQATALLNSPHTIQLFDFGVTGEGTFYYVMELLTGRDLESLVREFGPLPHDRAMFLLRQVCHSLADAHARGLVHRDIKPANIYVCRMGLEYDFVKVLDFGLVKFRDRAPSGEGLQTMDHRTTGTPAYMAPENHPRRVGRGPAGGRVRPGLRRLLRAHRPARVRRRHADEDADAARAGQADCPVAPDRAADSAAAGRARALLSREGPRPAAPERRAAASGGVRLQCLRHLELRPRTGLVGAPPARADGAARPHRRPQRRARHRRHRLH